MVDPEVISIGGGVSAAGEFLLSRISKYYKEYVFMHQEIHRLYRQLLAMMQECMAQPDLL